MTAQPALPGMVSAATFEADLRARDDDPTPRGVVAAVLGAVNHSLVRDPSSVYMAKRPYRVLDVCAGYGCWASEMRRWWDVTRTGVPWPVHITGVELDGRKREHLSKWCDEVHTGDWRQALGRDVACEAEDYIPGHDIVIGNPAFTHILRGGRHSDPKKRTPYKPVEETMPAVLLRHAPAVLLLHTSGAFTDSPHGREVWRRYPPAATWLCGRISFRSDGKTDSRTYQATLWLRGHDGPCATHMLPELSEGARRWTTLPGTEDAASAEALGLPMVGGS